MIVCVYVEQEMPAVQQRAERERWSESRFF